MKYSFFIFLLAFPFLTGFASCEKDLPETSNSRSPNNENINPMGGKIRIKVGAGTFTATLLNNETANKFRAMLPLTLKMSELNGNEKYFDLTASLPGNASNPGTIQSGDLMLYGANTLVLFYKTFPTSYSYSKIGRIDDATGLGQALGSNSVTITFEVQ